MQLQELLEATSASLNEQLAIIIYVFGCVGIHSGSLEARKFALSLKPATDTLLQSVDLYTLETLFI